MGRKNLLLTAGLVLVTFMSISGYTAVNTGSTKKMEQSQDSSKDGAITTFFGDEVKGSTHRNLSEQNSKDILAAQKNQMDDHAASCLNACQTRIVNLLTSEQELTASDAILISENAEVFAQILATKPNELASLLRWLQGDEESDYNVHLAAYAVISALSDEDRISASQALLVHQDPAYRIVGVRLAANSDTGSAEAARAFHTLASRETNPQVLITLLNSIPTDIIEKPYHPETIYTLDALIGSPSSDYIRGSALVAKSKLVRLPADAKMDVRQALRHPSSAYREYGLKAYAIMKERQFLDEDGTGQMGDDQEFQDILNTMIDDPDLDSDTRALALSLSQDF